MSTLYTRRLLRSEVDRFVAAAKGANYFIPTDPAGSFSLKALRVPDLDQYHFREFGSIFLVHETRETEGVVDHAFEVIEDCGLYTARTTARLSFAESGKPFDPVEERDVDVAFGIDRDDGHSIRVDSGVISPGYTDLAYRAQLFNGCFRALGLEKDLEAAVHTGRLRLEAISDRIRVSPEASRPPPGYDPAAANLVLLDVVEPDGSNFHGVILHTVAPGELRAATKTIVDHFGAVKVVMARLSLVCNSKAEFPAVRECLNASGLTPWQITCDVVSDYTLNDLDRAVGEHDSFWMRAFELKAPKVGKLDVDISYASNMFQLSFYFPYATPKKVKQLKSLIEELTGLSDVLLPEAD